MCPTKCQGQNDRMGRTVISCFCENLNFFSIGFATDISNFTLPPSTPLRFLYLINAFYNRYFLYVQNIQYIQ